jgi:hypothetical protein
MTAWIVIAHTPDDVITPFDPVAVITVSEHAVC